MQSPSKYFIFLFPLSLKLFKLIPKFIWKYKEPIIVKTAFLGASLLATKSYYKDTAATTG